MVVVSPTPVFERLSSFSLANATTGALEPVDAPVGVAFGATPAVLDSDADEPLMAQLSGLRSLSVDDSDEIFHAGGSPKMDEIETPTIASASKRLRGSDFDDETLLRLGEIQSTPPKSSPSAVHHTPITIPFFADVTPPTPPRRPTLSTRNSASPDSPGGVAARRAAAGKLPNKALASLQQMRFEAHDAGMGLGVGPGSPGFGPASPGPVEGMEGLSPGPGMTFRIALGLTNGKDVEGASSPVEEGENVYTNASTLASPTLLRQSSTSSNKRRPFSPSQAGEGVKIPPTLRGSKILDKLNLSSPPTLTSPLSMHRPERAAPPSPLILRTSAFTYSTTGPLTPLTPSHVPGAPSLNGGSCFDWSSYSLPDSPNCPVAPQRSIYHDTDISPRQPFFLPTPPSDSGRSPWQMSTPLAGSPLAERRTTNPFFSMS